MTPWKLLLIAASRTHRDIHALDRRQLQKVIRDSARAAYRDYWDQEHQRRSALHQQIGLRGNDLDELDFIESLKHRDLMKVLGVFQDTLRYSRIQDFTAAAFD